MITAARNALMGLLVAGALVVGVTSAGAGPNLVANPDFETTCGSVPCNWTADPPSTIASDTVNPQSGLASMAVTSAGSVGAAHSDCFVVSPSTVYTIGGWYRTTSTAVTGVFIGLTQYSDASCSTEVGTTFKGGAAVTTGAWTHLGGQLTTLAGIGSARVVFEQDCADICTATVNYDDVGLFAGALAVTVVSFTAHRAGKGVLVRWRTGTEANELGFNVYRQQGARRVRVNRRLLPALGAVAGSSYSYRDRRAPQHRAVRYWLQDVAVNGTRTWHGPVRVTAS